MSSSQDVGNMAAMRKALVEISKTADDWELNANTLAGALDRIYELANAALSAPARNCDVVPVEAPEAADVFHSERPGHGYCYETHDWLLAPATGWKGDNDGR